MWLNFEEKTINLKTYFLYLMKVSYFRHLNHLVGLQLQLSLIRTRYEMIKKPGFVKKILSGIKGLTFPKELEEYRQKYRSNTDLNTRGVLSEILEYLLSEFKDHFFYLDIAFNEEKMLDFIDKEFSRWLQSPDSSVEDLITKCGTELARYIEYPDFLQKGNLSIEKGKPRDLDSFWRYFFGKNEEAISRLEKQVKTWDWQDNNSIKAYVTKYQLQSKFKDTLRLRLMLEHSYEQAILDLVTRFEDWLALCFSTLAKNQPKRFLNTKGLKHTSAIRRLIEACEDLEVIPEKIITELTHLERLNVGTAGKDLQNYVENHAKYQINDPQGYFPFYVELRKLRDGIVHPEAVQQSSFEIPQSQRSLLDIVDKLTEFGLLLIETCNITTLIFDHHQNINDR